MAIASDNMVFYYMARDNLCFLALCEDAYPKRLAFLYLEEIADIIMQELLREYGSNVSSFSFLCSLYCSVSYRGSLVCIFRLLAEVRRHYPEHELLS